MAQVYRTQKKRLLSKTNDLYVKIPLLVIGLLLAGNLLIVKLVLGSYFCDFTDDLTPYIFVEFLGALVIAFSLRYTNIIKAKRKISQLFIMTIIAVLFTFILIYISGYLGFYYCWVF